MSVYSRYCVLLLAVSSACTTSPEELGKEPVDSLMAEIFIDVHLANARAELGYGSDGTPLDTIIVRRGLSRKEFDDRMAFYAEYPQAYLVVQNQIMDRLGQETRLVAGF
ncbi:MAG: hypothetical protein F4058_02600 [Rhodothermaceae bacterium]|nr:hypothetical protein [Rhodothermaceae bacterium]